MASYVNSVERGSEQKAFYTTLIEMTAGSYEEEGDFLLQAKVPVHIEIFPTQVSLGLISVNIYFICIRGTSATFTRETINKLYNSHLCDEQIP